MNRVEFEQLDLDTRSESDWNADDAIQLGQVEAHRIERNRAVEQWTNGFLEVYDQYGRVGVRRLLALLQEKGGKLSVDDCEKALADLPPRSELKQAMLRFLEKRGVARVEEGILIIDLEEFKNIKSAVIKEAGEFTYRSNATKQRTPRFAPYYEGQTRLLFFEALRDEKVISSTDYADGVREPKPLVYAPNSAAEALDEESIRQADFYLGLWDLPGLPPTDENGNFFYPTGIGQADWSVTVLASQLYNKNLGAAIRDESGKLSIKEDGDKLVPFTVEKLGKFGNATVSKYGLKVKDSLSRYIMEQGSDLLKADLLRLSDLELKSTDEIWTKYRFHRENAIIINSERSNPAVAFGGVKYILPKRFAVGPNYSLYQISSDLLGLVTVGGDGKKKLEYTFPIRTDTVNAQVVVGVSELGLEPYVPGARSVNNQEGVEFQELLDLGHEISRQTGVNLANIQLGEQTYAVAALREQLQENPDSTLSFIKKHGADGLRAFSALAIDADAGAAIFEIDKKYPPAQASLIFEKFGSFLDLGAEVKEQLVEACANDRRLGKAVTRANILGEFMKRAGRVLFEYAARNRANSATELLRELDAIRGDIAVFASFFKTYLREHGAQSALEIAGIDYQHVAGTALSRADKSEMINLSLRNYSTTEPDVPANLEAILRDSEKLKKTDFYVLRHQNPTEEDSTLVAFLRVEKQTPDQVYVGSFNVRKEAQQAGIAEQMISQTVIDLAKQYNVTAIMNQELAAGSLYIEQAGAVATGYKRETPTERGPIGHFEIMVEKNKAPSQLAGISRAELLKQYEQSGQKDPLAKIGEPVILAVFDNFTQKAEIATTMERLLNQEGYRMTRYVNLDGAGIRRLYGFEKISTAPVSTKPQK